MSAGRATMQRVQGRRGLARRASALLPHALFAAAAVAAAFPRGARAQDATAGLAPARTALLTGKYDEAEKLYRKATGSGDMEVEARRGLVRTLLTVGSYEEAEEAARDGLRDTRSPDLWTPLGRTLLRTGRLDEAATAFQQAVEQGARDSLQARLELAELRFQRGRRDEAMKSFDSFIDAYNRGGHLDPEELTAVGSAVRRLGRTNPNLFRDALRAYDEAVKADSSLLEPRVLTGELFLEKYNSADARRTFQEVLARNPRDPAGLTGLARTLDFDHDKGAVEAAKKALETNPSYVPAHVLLARIHIETDRFDEARREARAALDVDPASLDALAMLASVHHLVDDSAAFRRVVARADSLYPDNPTLPLTVAQLSADHRRYADAVAFADEAARRDPRSWESVGLLGLNLLRTDSLEAGRRYLEEAFQGDPYNVWFKNTLDLLDKWSDYVVRKTPHFEILVKKDEADVLAPYVERDAEAAFAALSRRYGHEPPTPIRVEVYPSHADFSVRTMGLVGLGALGVSFGRVIVLDSPSARDPASFNWASALWHETAHSVHMALSDQHVPRWFSEGLAVDDQRRGEKGWGQGVGIQFLRAWQAGKLPPASRIDDGLMRPDFPEEVVLCYYEASLVFQLFREEWGDEVVPRMLEAYGRGLGTDEVYRQVLGIDQKELDERFEAYLHRRFDDAVRAVGTRDESAGVSDQPGQLTRLVATHPDDFVARMRLGALLEERGDSAGAKEQYQAALELFPDYAGNDGPHWALAQIDYAQGRPQEAAHHLEALRSLNESHLPGALLEARIRNETGDPAGAAEALKRAVEIAPFRQDVHERLAATNERLQRWDEAVAERKAVVALAPVDVAQAWYQLARTELEAGDREAARTTVLRALERAPRFDDALDLLLRITGDAGEPVQEPDSIP